MTRASLAALVWGCGLLAVAAGVPAVAGPCSSQIATLDKQVSDSPALGPATTGALAGGSPAAKLPAANGGGPTSLAQQIPGTSASGKLGGTGGTKEMDAASTQVATSAQDVRRQQAGLPTMAADPNAKLSDAQNRMSQAKTVLAQARAQDARNDSACQASVTEAKKLLQ